MADHPEYPGNLIMKGHASATRFTALEQFPERLQQVIGGAMARAKAALAEQFKGLSTDGDVRTGLFARAKTGISVDSIVAAARAFAASLSEAERAGVFFPVDDMDAWRSWHNMHIFLFRHGLCLADLDESKRAAALAMVRETMSAAGFKQARDIMRLNEHVAELTGRSEEYGEWFYWISVFGTPSAEQPWGWQIDGHHLCVSCFVLGDQIVLTPDFRGSEPVEATTGRFAGTRVFEAEETLGFALMAALSPEQQALARIGLDIPREVLTIAQVDNAVIPYRGIRYTDLTQAQQDRLHDLVAIFTSRVRPGHAEIRFEEVKRHFDETYFAWIGACEAAAPFYYRIHSPVILIEFDHLPGIVYDNKEHTRRHVHSIVRTPNGGDYGRDLLRQHYLDRDHVHPHSPHRRGET